MCCVLQKVGSGVCTDMDLMDFFCVVQPGEKWISRCNKACSWIAHSGSLERNKGSGIFFLFSLMYALFFHCHDSSCNVAYPLPCFCSLRPACTSPLPACLPPRFSHILLMNDAKRCLWHCSQICLPWAAFRRSQSTYEELQNGASVDQEKNVTL